MAQQPNRQLTALTLAVVFMLVIALAAAVLLTGAGEPPGAVAAVETSANALVLPDDDAGITR